MRAVDIIRKKRDGEELTPAEIGWMVAGIGGDVPDYQWSALLMAIYMMGMNEQETAELTGAMMRSGSVVDLGAIPGRKIDKHSTGGVGDKTSLILAPIAAAAGVPVPMVSGRGLGHTGGTLDKLEAIPGFRVDLDLDRYKEVLRECGLVMIGQTAEIAPADKVLYALRDATATVESIPLIAASIMSKKLAEGIDGLVLDVKTGNGAFMVEEEDSRPPGDGHVRDRPEHGQEDGRPDHPDGPAAGPSRGECARGHRMRGVPPRRGTSRPRRPFDRASGRDGAHGRACELARGGEGTLSGRGGRRLGARAVPRHGRRPGRQSRLPGRSLAPAGPSEEVRPPARRDGRVQELAARPIGHATMLLGAGRARVDSTIDPAVGVMLHKKVGDAVREGEALCTLLVNDESRLEEASNLIEGAYQIRHGQVDMLPLIVMRLGD